MLLSRLSALLLGLIMTGSGSTGVYMKLATTSGVSFDAAVSEVRAASQAAGWTVLADYESGVNRQKCAYRAHVIIADWPEYSKAIANAGVRAAFASQVRLNVFEDEGGIHVSAVNPRSLNRTVVAENGRDAEWNAFASRIEQAVHAKVAGKTSEFGQMRENGRIGRTMGIMAGGPFEDKIETVLSVPLGGQSVSAVAARLRDGFEKQAKNGDWKIRPVFHQSLPGNVEVLGVTSESIEAKSADIVATGGDAARSKYRCPGIDHAAAYPVEVVIVKVGENAEIRLVDEMYRMKLFFEDAGKMAFMKNMGMPGSIESEIRAKILNSFKPVA